MENFKVDGILCEVVEPLCISHTGSAPYCYDGEIIVEKTETYRVVACYKSYLWSALFHKDDTEEKIKAAVAFGLRGAVRRFNKKIA